MVNERYLPPSGMDAQEVTYILLAWTQRTTLIAIAPGKNDAQAVAYA